MFLMKSGTKFKPVIEEIVAEDESEEITENTEQEETL